MSGERVLLAALFGEGCSGAAAAGAVGSEGEGVHRNLVPSAAADAHRMVVDDDGGAAKSDARRVYRVHALNLIYLIKLVKE